MAMPKVLKEIDRKLDAILDLLGDGGGSAPAVTKDKLMEIKGVGSSTADEILKLLGDGS